MTTRLSTVLQSTVLSLVIGAAVRLGTVDCGLWTQSFDCQDLLHNFVRRQVAFPAVEAAGAEFAAVGAADLGGNAERVAVARVAVKRRIGGNQNAFDERMVVQPPEEFLRGHRARPACGRVPSVWSEKSFVELFAQRLGQIRHRLPGRDAADVKPFEQLRDAINRLIPGCELGFQFLARQGFDVGQHVRNLTGASRETKRVIFA